MSDTPSGPDFGSALSPPGASVSPPDPYTSPNPYVPPGPAAPPPDAAWAPPPPPTSFNPYVVLPYSAPSRRATSSNIRSILGVVIALLACIGSFAIAVNREVNRHDNSATVAPLFPAPLVPHPSLTVGSLPTRSTVDTATMTKNRTADGTVMNSVMAKHVLTRYWRTHEQALVNRDLPTLRGLSVGAARRWEQAAVACGCLHVLAPRPLLDASYFVTRQTSFPATFVTEALSQAEGTYWTELLVFTKHAAGAPWLVSEDSGFGPPPGAAPSLGHPDLAPAGYDQRVSPAQAAIAHHVAAHLAAVWQQAKDTGSVPVATGFNLTGQAGDRVAMLASTRQDAVQANGVLGHYTFSTSSADGLVQVSDHGDDLACQPIREVVQHRAPPGRAIHQDNGRELWGPGLAPGDYQQVTSTDVWQTCFLIPPAPGGPIEVLDQDVGGSLTTAPVNPA